MCVIARVCVFTLRGRSFLRVRDVSGIYSAQSYFSGCNICFTIDRQKLPALFIATTTSFLQKVFATSPHAATSAPSGAQMQAQQCDYTQKHWQRTSEKDRMMKSLRKDQSLYIISAINTLVHLPTTCFFYPCWLLLISPVLCATCCAGPC